MMNREKTCEERIDDELARAMDYIREALASDEARQEYEEGILEVAPLYTVYRVGLSWGGPADGFYVYVDPVDHEIVQIEYYFQDWFDGAKRRLTGSDLDAALEMFGWIAEMEANK